MVLGITLLVFAAMFLGICKLSRSLVAGYAIVNDPQLRSNVRKAGSPHVLLGKLRFMRIARKRYRWLKKYSLVVSILSACAGLGCLAFHFLVSPF